MQCTVVGAGVIGLSTALALEEHGHDVRIVADGVGGATTSAVAGAVWFPYKAGPPARVVQWAIRTRQWLDDLAKTTPEAGVDVLTGYEITPDDSWPWWAEGVSEIVRAPAPVKGAPIAWKFTAPRAQPSLFLPWLQGRLKARVEQHHVSELADVPGDVVINCTGLAARELAHDDAMYPLLGQLVIAEVGGADLTASITDDRDPDSFFYIIPRRDELVLGGCSLPREYGSRAELDAAIKARIVAHAARLGIQIGDVRGERVGLRPYRPEVRLERDSKDPRIIHNYGHGGAGFTLSRGCAEDVAALVASR
ncbi:MAG TPA: FAD-dependent oxidoreductase [Kofleriaceae bacterium]|nr:FAD-dependent oxidoreductase [Kofleriaceae bacterium]